MKWIRPEFVLFVLLCVFLLPLCGWIFGCGCSHLWSGGLTHCSIHDPNRPDCPWCIVPLKCSWCAPISGVIQMIPFVSIFVLGWIPMILVRKRKSAQFWRDFIIGLVAMFAASIFIGWIYGVLTGYPYFLPSILSRGRV